MRDDDHGVDDELDSPLGKLIYTEFDSSPERADYALPLGEAALAGRGPEFELDEQASTSRTLSRRQALALGVLGGLCAGGSFAWGLVDNYSAGDTRELEDRKSVAELAPRIQMMLDGARVVASKSIDDLVRVHAMYLWLVQHHASGDPALWKGVERLAQWSLLDGKHRGVAMARRILVVMESVSLPPSLHSSRLPLEELVWGWDRGGR